MPDRQPLHHAPEPVAERAEVRRPATPAEPTSLPWLASVGGNRAVSRLLSRSATGPAAPADFADRLAAGSGRPIPDQARENLESGLGASLSGVRLHTDSTAATMATQVSARAFTVGQNIYFGAGQYDPGSGAGYRLLAHEVTHTLQQSGAAGTGELTVSSPDSPAEREAEAVADRLGNHATAPAPTAGADAAVHRQHAPPASQPAPMSPAPPADPLVCRPEDVKLASPNAEVDGKTVAAVGADLQGRNRRYRELIPKFRRGSEETQRDEQQWYDNLGITGRVIEWKNDAKRTDPARWARVFPLWDKATADFDAAIAKEATTKAINDTGQASVTARGSFEEASQLDNQLRAEYQRYLQGFSNAAQDIITVSTVVRDVSFATAVALAAVVAAPVVAGAVSAFGTGTLGLTAGSTGATLFTYGGTAVGMGVLGAGIEGTGQAAAALGAQASAALVDLIRGSERAADNFDLGQVGQQGWEGMRRGFVDGVLAFAGAQAEKVVASFASQAVRSYLGPANSSLMSLVIRRAATRAISGGATGSVIGALQAGLNAAIAGKDLAGIAADMERGFVVGVAAGATLGAVGGAVEARGAHALRQSVLPKLRSAAEAGNNDGAERLFQGLQQKLDANPGVGTNDQLRQALPNVWRALRDPDAIANSLADVWLEEHLLGLMAPRDAASRYGQAAMVLSKRAGAPVVVLPRGTSFTTEAFYNDVVLKGNRFLDLSVLDLSPEHGASTHMIQDLVVDRALRGTGLRAEQLRGLFAGATDAGGEKIGNALWIELYDSFQQGLNQPEIVYPILNKGLGGLQ